MIFNVIEPTDIDASTFTQRTEHIEIREERERLVKSLQDTSTLGSFIVDRGHPNGLEVHTIKDNGVIYIGNLDTQKLITYLVARPHQIERYGIINEHVKQLAYEHYLKRYNY